MEEATQDTREAWQARRQEWETLKAEVLTRIEAIDKATPWGPIEPTWWVHMMDVARLIRDGGNE